MSRYRIMSVQWIDVEDVDTLEDAIQAASSTYYDLEEHEREALPAVAFAVDLDDLEHARFEVLEVLDRCLGFPQ